MYSINGGDVGGASLSIAVIISVCIFGQAYPDLLVPLNQSYFHSGPDAAD